MSDGNRDVIDVSRIEAATEDQDFDDALDAYACHLLTEAQKDGVKLEEKIKVFAAIQPYHAAREKYKGRIPGAPNRTTGKSFADFKQGVKEQ